MKPCLVISLDFELFWGVCDSQNVNRYGKNILGEWDAIPKILDVFKRYKISATWATVGMVMCRNYKQWCDIKPELTPAYSRSERSTFEYAGLAKEYPSLFFGRTLVEDIISTPRQEIGGHSYSHFYTNEQGATAEQFSADLACAGQMAREMGLDLKSFVFPRNQYKAEFVAELVRHKYKCFRGNSDHWLYKQGHDVPYKFLGKSFRLIDQYISISGNFDSEISDESGILNIPASCFLRPYNSRLTKLDFLRMARIKRGMLTAAKSGKIFHLWWHPHNFGLNIEENLSILVGLLEYYMSLSHEYGMQSMSMRDFVCRGDT